MSSSGGPIRSDPADHVHLAHWRRPSRPRRRPAVWRHDQEAGQFPFQGGRARIGHRQPHADRQPGKGAQRGQRPVRDLAAPFEDDHAVGLRLHLGQRVDDSSTVAPASRKIADDLVEALAQAPGPARSSARPGAAARGRPAAPGPSPSAGACPWSRCRPGASAAAAPGRRGPAAASLPLLGSALQPGVEGQDLPPGHRGMEGDGLRQEADLAAPMRRRRCRRGRRPDTHGAPSVGAISPSSSLMRVVLPAPLWPTSATHSPGSQRRR